MDERTVQIAGAGFAGLTLGILLARRGWDVQIYERADSIREVGAGIFMKSNGLVVLEEMGLMSRLKDKGIRLEHDRLQDETGRVLQDRELEADSTTWSFPRQDLIETFHQAAVETGVAITTGCSVIGAHREGYLELNDGTKVAGDLVVGADGYRSKVRESLELTKEFRTLPTVSTRYLLEGRDLSPKPMTSEHWSGRRRIAFASASQHKTYVYLASPEDDSEGKEQPLNVSSWEQSFPHLGSEFEILHNSEAYQAHYSQVSCDSWSKGTAAVVGDAAHALAPCLAQGWNLALMNVRSLVEHLDESEDVPTALMDWENDIRRITDVTQTWSALYDRLTRDWPSSLAAVRAAIIWAFGFPFFNERMRVAERHRVVQ